MHPNLVNLYLCFVVLPKEEIKNTIILSIYSVLHVTRYCLQA